MLIGTWYSRIQGHASPNAPKLLPVLVTGCSDQITEESTTTTYGRPRSDAAHYAWHLTRAYDFVSSIRQVFADDVTYKSGQFCDIGSFDSGRLGSGPFDPLPFNLDT